MQKNRIVELKHKLHKIESAKRYIIEIGNRIKENEEKLEKAEEQLRKENKDVEKLKSASLTNVIAWFKKDKEERLSKEENEAMRAAVYVKQLEEEHRSLIREHTMYSELLTQEAFVLEQLEKLQLEAMSSSAEKRELLTLRSQVEEEELLLKELEEAIEAGYDVLAKLDTVLKELSSAQGWGMYDIVAGGMVSSLVKHSHIDKAQERLADLQNDILRFQKEVQDVSEIASIQIAISTGMRFIDVGFDNAFVDFMVQSKINASIEHVQLIHDKIMTVQKELLEKRTICKENLLKNTKLYQDKLLEI